MSFAATRWAWDVALPDFEDTATPTVRYILLALADRANESYVCWPGLRSLAKRTGLGTRTIRTAIAALRNLKLVEVLSLGKGAETTRYKLPVVKLPTKDAAREAGEECADVVPDDSIEGAVDVGVAAAAAGCGGSSHRVRRQPPQGMAAAATNPTKESIFEPIEREEAPPVSLSEEVKDSFGEGSKDAATASDPAPTAAAEKAPPKPKATPLPADWTPNTEQRAHAVELGLDPDAAAKGFVAYWRTRPDVQHACWNAEWVESCARYQSWKRYPLSKQHWTGSFFDNVTGGLPESPFAAVERREERIRQAMQRFSGSAMPSYQEIGSYSVWATKKKVWDAEQTERRAKATRLVDAEDAARRMAEERAAEAAGEAARAAAAAEGSRGPVIDGELVPDEMMALA